MAPRGDIAQLGEHRPCKAEVTGSIPVISTKYCSLTTEYDCVRLIVGPLVICRIICRLRQEIFGQVTKGIRGMPWHEEAMKDVASCDKLRGGASNL